MSALVNFTSEERSQSSPSNADRHVVVTGALGCIGEAVAEVFLEEGYRVTGIIRSGEDLLDGLYTQICWDVRKGLPPLDRIDCLVTCAASRTNDLRDIMDVDVLGTLACCRDAVKIMSRGGSITNLASYHAFGSYPDRTVYAMAKSAVVGMSQQLAVELGPRGIRVNCVAPGTVDSPRVQKTFSQNMTLQVRLLSRTPLRRFASPDEVAKAVFFLATHTYINGETLIVDGGFTKDFYA